MKYKWVTMKKMHFANLIIVLGHWSFITTMDPQPPKCTDACAYTQNFTHNFRGPSTNPGQQALLQHCPWTTDDGMGWWLLPACHKNHCLEWNFIGPHATMSPNASNQNLNCELLRGLRQIEVKALHSSISSQRGSKRQFWPGGSLSEKLAWEGQGHRVSNWRRRQGYKTKCKNWPALYSHGEGARGGRHSPQVGSLHLMDARGSREWAARTVSATA